MLGLNTNSIPRGVGSGHQCPGACRRALAPERAVAVSASGQYPHNFRQQRQWTSNGITIWGMQGRRPARRQAGEKPARCGQCLAEMLAYFMTVGNPVTERGEIQLMLFTILFSGQATVPPLGHMVLFLLRGISATAHGVSLQVKIRKL